ncbi:hypothetical protein F2Q69_00042177 [Brassica cretica]|uniref:Uncharacterized protein n=1 Tax=Brassica cretica TaxID=69181 RepID=A0A8S9NBJ3_BRACR|nr:hypothetical protein F2Q69_00042177 [Brassica cretica]
MGTRRPLRPYKNPEVSSLDLEIFDWNPEEPRGSSFDPEIFDWNPKAIREPGGTVLRLPRQGYYRKSLTGLEGACVGVMTQVPGFAAFHVGRSMILIAPWTPMRLRLPRFFGCFVAENRKGGYGPGG